jgi:hypothetical protein
MYIIYVPRKFGYVPQFWAEERKVGYVSRFWAEEHKVGYVPRFWPRNISSHMFLSFGPRNISSDMFLGSTWLRNITYVSRPRCPCSLMFIKIYSSVMFLGHQHMFLGFWPRNICLFPIV